MLQKIRWVMAAQLLLLGLLWMGLPLEMQAGDKLRKLKEDVQRVQHGTLLIAPILPDSFVLRKYDRPEEAAKRTAYLESLQAGTANLQAAIQKHYRFSRVEVLPAFADYPSYHAALQLYEGKPYYVLQFGHMAQFAAGRTKKASNYDKGFLGIYELDASSKMFLNQGKVNLFPKLTYAESIVRDMEAGLTRYARVRGKSKTPALLTPALTGKVALLPQERLYGTDSLTFLNGAYQTVVTTLPVKAYRAFGGVALPGGTFVTLDSIRDTSAVRRDLAILMTWGNTLEFEAVLTIPVATKINIGQAAPQADLTGGGTQVILPYRWPLEWITRIYHLRSDRSWTLAEFQAAYPAYFQTK